MGKGRVFSIATAAVVVLNLGVVTASGADAAQRGGNELCVAVSGGTVQNATVLDIVADGGTGIGDASGGNGNLAAAVGNDNDRANGNNNNGNNNNTTITATNNRRDDNGNGRNNNRNDWTSESLDVLALRLLQTDTASAGNGGVANASANGGAVSIQRHQQRRQCRQRDLDRRHRLRRGAYSNVPGWRWRRKAPAGNAGGGGRGGKVSKLPKHRRWRARSRYQRQPDPRARRARHDGSFGRLPARSAGHPGRRSLTYGKVSGSAGLLPVDPDLTIAHARIRVTSKPEMVRVAVSNHDRSAEHGGESARRQRRDREG